nr:2b protein [Cucumber mosaic virus]
METTSLVESTAALQLAQIQEVKRRRRKSHVLNRRARGHKSPSEQARSHVWFFRMLPFHGVDPVEWLPESARPRSFVASGYESFDDTDWFAGNEWAEGSF